MNYKNLLFLLMAATPFFIKAQSIGVGIGTTTPNSSAALDITSPNKGLLIPRMSTLQPAKQHYQPGSRPDGI